LVRTLSYEGHLREARRCYTLETELHVVCYMRNEH